MATFIPVTNLPKQEIDTDGTPLTSGTYEFYLAGTDTATDLFSDSSGTSIGTSITLNSRGYPESGGNLITLFRDQSKALKVVAKNAAGATLYTTDNIPAVASFDATSSAKLDLITVTSAANLDTMTTDIAGAYQVDGSVVLTADVVVPTSLFVNDGTTAGITASTTQTQGNGVLVSAVNEVSVVGSTNDTVTLPAAAAGRPCAVINNGANTLQVFPASGGYIGALAINLPVTLATGTVLVLKAYNTTVWEIVSIVPSLGTSGYVLTSNGTTALPTFQAQTSVAIPVFKSYGFNSRDAANGVNYSAGYYEAPAADTTLSNASLTQTLGTAVNPYAAHAFAVTAGGATTDGSDLVVTVSGTSITDAGVRTGTDSEVLISGGVAAATDEYFETVKKWVGTVTYTITSTGGATFTMDLNYGFCKYEDFGNRSFTLTDFEVIGLCNATDTGFDIELLHHKATGWTYSAAAFVAGSTALAKMTTIHGTESDLTAAKYFAFKRASMTTAIDGSASEGLIVRVTDSVNNSITYMDSHIGVTF